MTEPPALARKVVESVERVIVGKRPAVELCVASLLARGHVLVEDVPGTGKTMLARSLAASLGMSFKRIQCTPDLLPNDVTGVNVFDPRSAEFRFRPGPVFANLVLADEVNRATPRTQAALLEAMQERQVTVDGETRTLGEPFMVIATQNPIEFEGTFPLPEAQLDRFLVSVSIGYPDEDQETGLVRREGGRHPAEDVAPVATPEEVREAMAVVDRVFLSEEVARYLVRILAATRGHPRLALGASPRAGMALAAISRALAAIEGRDYVTPDQVKRAAPHVLAHRVLLTPESRLHGETAGGLVERILDDQPVEPDGG